MFNKLRTTLAAAAAFVAGPAFAQIDISTTATAIQTDLVAVITAIGTVLLVAAGTAVAYKWAKAALFS